MEMTGNELVRALMGVDKEILHDTQSGTHAATLVNFLRVRREIGFGHKQIVDLPLELTVDEMLSALSLICRKGLAFGANAAVEYADGE